MRKWSVKDGRRARSAIASNAPLARDVDLDLCADRAHRRRDSMSPAPAELCPKCGKPECAALRRARYDHHKTREGVSIFTSIRPDGGSDSFETGATPGAGHVLLHRLRLPPLAARGRRAARLPALRRLLLPPRLDLRVDAGARRRRPPSSRPPHEADAPDWLDEARAMLPGRRPLPRLPRGRRRRSRSSRSSRAGPGSAQSAAADIRLDDPSVSRRHALIVSEQPEALRVLDDRSLNGVSSTARDRVGAGSSTATSWRSAATGSSPSKPERRGSGHPGALAVWRRADPATAIPPSRRGRSRARPRTPARGNRAGPHRRRGDARRAGEPRFVTPRATAEELRRELDELRLETRGYVKRRVRKSEKKLKRSIRELEARSDKLEQRTRPGRGRTASTPSGASTTTPSRCSTACSTRSARSPTCLEAQPGLRDAPRRAAVVRADAAADHPVAEGSDQESRAAGRSGAADRHYSVEMLGSAWTLCGTTIRKFSARSAASSRIRSASSSWSVARSSLGVVA